MPLKKKKNIQKFRWHPHDWIHLRTRTLSNNYNNRLSITKITIKSRGILMDFKLRGRTPSHILRLLDDREFFLGADLLGAAAGVH